MYDVSVVGHLTKDNIITPSKKMESIGGTVLYFGVTAYNLGLDTFIYTKLSKEDEKFLNKIDYPSSQIQANFGRDTTHFVNIYQDKSLTNRKQKIKSIAEPFSMEDIKRVPESKIIHLGPLLNQDFDLEVLKYVVNSDKFEYKSMDLQGLTRIKDDENILDFTPDDLHFLKGFDFLHCDDEEAKIITGTDNVGEAIDILSEYSNELVITMADEGSIVSNDSLVKIPAFKPPELVDTTGCGDTYSAAYLFKRLKDWSVKDSARFAASSATLKSRSFGTFESDSKEVEKFMSSATELSP